MLSLEEIFCLQPLARVPINLVDKGIAVFAAWLILMRLPDSLKNLAGGKRSKKSRKKRATDVCNAYRSYVIIELEMR